MGPWDVKQREEKTEKTQTQVPGSGSARRVQSCLGYGIVIPYLGYRIYIERGGEGERILYG
jgi:hypothetical protein